MAKSLIARSREFWEANEISCVTDKTEYFSTFSKRSKDLFGFVDFVAITGMGSDAPQVYYVQSTSYDNMLARMKKILDEPCLPIAEALVDAGTGVVVEGWKKEGNRWQCYRSQFDGEQFSPRKLATYQIQRRIRY